MNKQNSNFIPERLIQLRIASHLTQTKLAKDLNISRSCLANYETGKRKPDKDMQKIIANYFNVSVDFFFPSDNTNLLGNALLRTSKDFMKNISANDKLDMTRISPLSKVALIEFYNFLQEQERISNNG